MSDWQLMPVVDPFAAARFADLDAVFALEGDVVAQDSMTRTLRVEINGSRYYVKRYAGLGKKPLRRWLATPRVQLEWENLQRFSDWGIPSARLVGYGLERKAGRFLRGALITAEIPQTTDLGEIARAGDPRLKSRRWQDGIARQVAAIARQMHDRRFVHGDLKWRNLLVDAQDKVFLIDCPSGAFWWPPFLEYRVIKDLACLDKLARRHLSRSRRLRFYLDYVQRQTLDAADKQRLRKILRFFEGRDEALATAASLRTAGRNLQLRADIALDDGSVLAVEQWLRILPGKRLTGIGSWRGHPVLAKLFIAARGSERHWQRECRGAETLKRHALLTPALLATGQLAEGGHFALYDYLASARSPVPTSADDMVMVFRQAGLMHGQGLVQQDAHLGNFLIKDNQLYVIDGDAIRSGALPIECARNLALLFAQLQPDQESALLYALLESYRSAIPSTDVNTETLSAEIKNIRAARLDDYLNKCLRDCSLFKATRRVDKFFAALRSEVNTLAPLIHDPDAWLEKGTPLKRGNTATLARVEINGRPLVIKRYNIKSPGHALSRCWRPSRAWHSWIEGHRLEFLGIATPSPLALIEQRLGPLRGKAWLITDYCPGENLADHLALHLESPPPATVASISHLFSQLFAARITHGDLKATNLIWHNGTVQLIDLDAMRQHDDPASFARAWRRDRERFLRNWPENSALRRALEQVLPVP